jgi:hypothetical protein
LGKKPLENKVAQKAILAFDPEKFLPKATDIAVIDLKQFLFMELLLKEKDYREALKTFDFSPYTDKYVMVTCSTDAIIPMWAYMLIASYLNPFAKKIVYSNSLDEAKEQFLIYNIKNLDNTQFVDQRIVIKGCGSIKVTPALYLALMEKFQPLAKAINFGEACSMVPVSKKV